MTEKEKEYIALFKELSEIKTKKDLIARVEAMQLEEFPPFENLDLTGTHADILERIQVVLIPTVDESAEDGVEEGMDAAEKAEAFDRLISENPELVLLPRYQALLRVSGDREDDLFEISAIPKEDSAMSYITSLEEARRPFKEAKTEQELADGDAEYAAAPKVQFTPAAEVPEWAKAKVYDLIVEKRLRAFMNEDEGLLVLEQKRNKTFAPLFDSQSGDMGMRIVADAPSGFGRQQSQDGAYARATVKPTASFTKVEQEVAWNVINKTISGEGPLPGRPSDVSVDPKDITRAELDHVRSRILEALDSPEKYAEREIPVRAGAMSFDTRVFYNQLLACEYSGYTPSRGNGNKVGGTRKAVLKLIRELAEDAGFEVVGDYVIRKTADKLDNQRLGNFTQNTSPFGVQEMAKTPSPYKAYDAPENYS